MLGKPIVRDASWVVAGQVVTVVAGLVGLKALTTLLPLDEYGRMALVLGCGTLVFNMACSPILQAILRAYPDGVRDGRACELRGLGAAMLERALGLAALLMLVGGAIWAAATGQWRMLALLFAGCLVLATDVGRTFEANLLNATRQQGWYAIRLAADAVARPLVACLLVALVSPGAGLALVGYAVGSAAVLYGLRRRVVRDVSDPAERPDPEWAGRTRLALLQFAIPLAPLAVLNWLTSLGNRYVLAAFAGAAEVGAFAAAFALASQPFLSANTLVHATLRPVLYDAAARGDVAKQRRTLVAWFVVSLGIGLGGTLGFALFAPTLASLLLGPGVTGAAPLLPWIAAAYGIQGVQQTFEIMLYAWGLTGRTLAVQIFAAVAAVTAYLLWIPAQGALGAARATLGAMLCSFVASVVLAWVSRGSMPGRGAPP